MAYRALLASAVKAGLSPMAIDNTTGRSVLHVFCIQLGSVSMETYPDGGNCLHAILHACFDESATSGVGRLGARADSTGQTLFSLVETLPGSWLSASKKLLHEAVSRMTGTSSMRGMLVELKQPAGPRVPLRATNDNLPVRRDDRHQSLISEALSENFASLDRKVHTDAATRNVRGPQAINVSRTGVSTDDRSRSSKPESINGKSNMKSIILPPR